MNILFDEGYIDDDSNILDYPIESIGVLSTLTPVQQREELAYRLLSSLPRSRLATIQRRIAPLLQFDVVGSLPAEVSLQIFSYLSSHSLLTCSLVSRRWRALSNDQSLWKQLCHARGWKWRQSPRTRDLDALSSRSVEHRDDSDDEGMGDSDEEAEEMIDDISAIKSEHTQIHAGLDSGFVSMSSTGVDLPFPPSFISSSVYPNSADSTVAGMIPTTAQPIRLPRHSAPPVLPSFTSTSFVKPNYKLLHLTHTRLYNRFLSSSYRLSTLQTRGTPTNAHANTIYCLQLYTYASTGLQVLFTGSRDRTVREWNLTTGLVLRVISGVHDSSVLSLCVHNGYLASAGSDRRVVVWDLENDKLVKVICDHEDSVLCVRFDNERLVSCSKDRTVRTYTFPDLERQFVLGAHRAAVNAVSISETLIVSGSGDRSVRLWCAKTGKLLRTFENHHTRGIASIDFKPPYVLSGSSDKHVRLFDVTSFQGWSTSPDYQHHQGGGAPPSVVRFPSSLLALSGGLGVAGVGVCQVCGTHSVITQPALEAGAEQRGRRGCVHADLVRSVALGDDFVLSGSYDLSIKVWDRKTGTLVADLTGGHTGRIFCIGFDSTKIISCGEDQRICIWDFSHGIDTSFIQL